MSSGLSGLLFLIALVSALAVAAHYGHCAMTGAREWHPHGTVMRRRRPDGTWEIREMTADEANDTAAW